MQSWTDIKSDFEATVRESIAGRLAGELGVLSEQSRATLSRDLEELKQLVFDQRSPRLAVIGRRDLSLQQILEVVGASTDYLEVREALGHGRWYDHRTDVGDVRLADLRADEGENWLRALDYEQPDVVLAVACSNDTDVQAIADGLIEALDRADETWSTYPPALVAIFRPDGTRVTTAGDFKTRQALRDAFAERGFSRDFVDVVPAANRQQLARKLVEVSPIQTRLALARMTDDHKSKVEIAEDLLAVATSVSAAIASVPIPVADIVPLTTVQVSMLGGIAYLGGRTVNVSTLREFLVASGVSVGAGLALREVVRLFARLIPVAGPVVSAAVAAGATQTLGRAAIRHYLR